MCIEVNKDICEASGCFKKATTKINVKVGNLGSISLHLCTNCVKKFDVKEQVEQSNGSINSGGILND